MSNFMTSNMNKSLLFMVSLLDFMGFTIGATIFPEMILSSHSHLVPQHWDHSLRLLSIGLVLCLYPVGQFLSASIFGALSDAWGRKKVISITLFGTVISSLLTACSIQWGGIYLLLLSRFVLGLFAGNVSVAQAAMVDMSTEKTRAANLSLIQLTLGLAWVFGAPLGSVLSNSQLVSWFDGSTPFFFLTLALCIVTFLFVFSFEETHHIKKKLERLHPFWCHLDDSGLPNF